MLLMSDSRKDDATAETDEGANRPEICDRRRFLGHIAGAAGSLALGVAAAHPAAAQNGQNAPAREAAADVVLKLNEKAHQGLNQIGGSEVITTADGAQVIVAHPEENTFVACSAICTHRGGHLFYDHGSKQFACPLHGARFDLAGKVVHGPAQTPLQSYAADPAIVVEGKPVT
jgi:cytochrome b6-f complex iron-sulfur subunit